VSLASRGQRDMDTGAETIADEAQRARIQQQARHVKLQSLTTAVVLTVLTLLIR
jgi:ABC-type uncharacterized transport system involved in gliding motility auxiliary subunit